MNETSYFLGAILGAILYAVSVLEAHQEEDSLKVKHFHWARLMGMFLVVLSITALIFDSFAAKSAPKSIDDILELGEAVINDNLNNGQIRQLILLAFLPLVGICVSVWFVKVLNVHIRDVDLGSLEKASLKIQIRISHFELSNLPNVKSDETPKLTINDLYDRSASLLRRPNEMARYFADGLENVFSEHGIEGLLKLTNGIVPKRESFRKHIIQYSKNGLFLIYENENENSLFKFGRYKRWPPKNFYVASS